MSSSGDCVVGSRDMSFSADECMVMCFDNDGKLKRQFCNDVTKRLL